MGVRRHGRTVALNEDQDPARPGVAQCLLDKFRTAAQHRGQPEPMSPAAPTLPTAADLTVPPGHWLDGYRPPTGSWDEVLDVDGSVRPAWRSFATATANFSPSDWGRRRDDMARLLRDHGVTYNVYSDTRGAARPWQLDALPLVIERGEFEEVAAGLSQRLRLFNADLGRCVRTAAAPARRLGASVDRAGQSRLFAGSRRIERAGAAAQPARDRLGTRSGRPVAWCWPTGRRPLPAMGMRWRTARCFRRCGRGFFATAGCGRWRISLRRSANGLRAWSPIAARGAAGGAADAGSHSMRRISSTPSKRGTSGFRSLKGRI